MGAELPRARWYVVLGTALAMLVWVIPAHADTASLTFDPPAYEFGTKLPATPAPSKAFTLTNTGEFSLPIETVALAWGPQEYAEPEMFKITSNDCGTLASGQSCTIEVAFNPVLPGPKWGTITVAAPWSENCNLEQKCQPVTIHAQLHLTGILSTVSLSPDSVRFLPLEVETGSSPPKTVTLTNEGEFKLTIFRVMLANYRHHDSSQFRISGGTCAPELVLLPHGTCTVGVAFSPSDPGSLSGELGVLDSATVGSQFTTLEGEGIAAPQPQALSGLVPRVSILRGPARLSAKRGAVLWFRGSLANPAFECKLDAGSFVPCVSPARFKYLGLGHHSFAVRELDANGKGESEAARYRWRVEPRR